MKLFRKQGTTRSRKENVVVVKKVRGRVRQTTTTEAPETTRRTVAVRTRASYNTNRNTNRESTRERGSDSNEEIKVKTLTSKIYHDDFNNFHFCFLLSASIPYSRKYTTFQIGNARKSMVNEIQSEFIPTC
jgi:hypothetical protein